MELLTKELKEFGKMVYADTLGVSGKGAGCHKHMKSVPTLCTMESLYKFGQSLYEEADLEEWPLHAIVAAMLAAQKDEKEDVINRCLNRLITASQSLSNIRFAVQRNYIRYGVDELRHIYDMYPIEDFYTMTAWGTREEWRGFKIENLLPYFNGTLVYNQTKFVATFLSCRVQDVYKKMIRNIARENGYENLSFHSLQLYVRIRKSSNYEMTLSSWTPAEVWHYCVQNNISTTYVKVLNMYKQFNHETKETSDKESILPLHERPSWKATHRNEVIFWNETEADKISEEEVRDELRHIQMVMNYSDIEIARIYNWLNIARYEGRADSTISLIPDTLDTRYRVNKKDSDMTISKRIRRDIIETMGTETRVLLTLSKNLGGNYWKSFNK